ncbi:hypothetical protein A3G14_03550 [Candidatus Curtissbacteria bacterium RIFCSPLOWO2_12_FULL_38_9]|uniref:Membrane protein 6-pyruvoyl-tetrahydropterin synthase-related domain-containing protein n=1 Tax=Candidatus Curtissbacteria bacterium RIFCSPLOWO2_12_FULL_38_9 TaxID=1797735 RepID=A0A1F5I7E3_9BACT|nr:MAG: hypothetical protein A3G14_03550 [Candidatus Curtissbacteria bacterium RIFCSPLOWO2_12_FULL_38_9]
MKTNLVAIMIILFFSVLVSLPLLKSGLFLMHDDQHVARLFVFDEALKATQFPVRWVNGLGFGFGYPLFVFYPPLVYMLGEIYHLMGFGFIDSIKLVFFSSILFSGLAMYVFAKDLWGKFPALISALFYLLVPYRALDVYVRGALAESFAFVWPPLILWSLYKTYKTDKTLYVYLSVIFLALLMITHNLIFLPFMLLLPFYLLFLIWHSSRKLFTIYHFLFTIALAMGLSAYFWIPAILEKKYTIVDEMLLQNLADFRIHFVYPQQLWNWTWGFGGSAEGLADGISFKIGKLHILVSFAAVILVLATWIKNRNKFKSPFTIYYLPFTFFILFLFSAFMTTFYSKFIWEIVKPLGYLQFPWRYLTFTVLFSSILSGAFIYYLKLPVFKLVFGAILIFVLLFSNLKLFKPREYRFDLTDEIATSSEVINWDVSKTSFEYVPKEVTLYQDGRGVNMFSIKKSEIPENKLELISGTATLQIVKNNPDEIAFNVESLEDSVLRANVFNFPGWHVLVDKQNTPINDNNDLKLITFKVPQGVHEVKVQFKNTNVRTYANMLTLGSVIVLIMLIIRQVTNRSGRFEMRK